LAKIGPGSLETALRHPGNVEQLVYRGEWAFAFAKLDDALPDRPPDSGHGPQRTRIGRIDVDACLGRRLRAVPGVSRLTVNARRLSGGGDIDLIAVGRRRSEVDAGGVGLRTQAAGQFDRPRVTVAELQMVEAGPSYRARDVDDQIAARPRVTRPVCPARIGQKT
jgi:hypothetical protein